MPRPCAVIPATMVACLALLLLAPPVAHAGDPPADEDARADELEGRMNDLYRAGKYKEALEVAGEVVPLRERLHGAEDTRTARAQGTMGLCLEMLGRLDEAQPLLERSFAIVEKVAGPEAPETLSARLNLGMLLRERARYKEALPLFETTVEIADRVLPADEPFRAIAWNNLALILQDVGQLERARDLLERVVEFRSRVLGPEDPATATGWNNLGNLLEVLRDLPGAERALRRALEIREKALGPDHPATASSLNNVALLLTAEGRAEEAVPLFERAVAIREKRQGAGHPLTAVTLGNLGLALKALGRLDQAQALYERSLAILEAALGPEHPVVAVQENKLAVLLQQRGELEQARVHHERALKIRRAKYGSHHQFTGESLNNLGLTLHLLHRPAEAEPLYREALKAFDSALGEDHPDTASVWNNLGIVLKERGERKEARACIERAIAVKETALGPLHPGLAQLLSNLAELAILEGDTAQARALYARSLDIVEASARRALGLLQGQERLALAESVRWLLRRRLAAAAALGDSGYAEALRFKGLVGRLERAERQLARSGGKELAARFDALASAHRRLAALANARVPRRDAERHAVWQESYAKAAAEVDRLAGALAAERGGVGAAMAATTSIEDLQRALSDTVLVDLLRTGSGYVAWVVRRDARIVRVELGPAQPIEEASDALAAKLASASAGDAWQEAAERLAALVWTPLEPHLGGTPREIYLSPDARLSTVPFELLAPAARAVRRVTMAQDVISAATAARGSGGLYVGAVDFERAEGGAGDAAGRMPAPAGSRFTALPGTRAEVEALATLEGETARALLGAAATEAALRRDAKGRRVLHVATHGFVRGDLARAFRLHDRDDLSTTGTEELNLIGYDPRVLSGLALAGANTQQGGGGDDGILTALEAAALDLEACELVVLSACETAGGASHSGEGVLGLAQAMQDAGARSVVASLWKVDDEATRALMTKFYELRAAKDPPSVAAALRAAQEHVRGEPRWAHPYYWAAWISWERAG